MRNTGVLLSTVLSMLVVFSLIVPALAVGDSPAAPVPDDRAITCSVPDTFSAVSPMALNTPGGHATPMVAVGEWFIAGLKPDGTVVTVGDVGWRDLIGRWTDIAQVALGFWHMVGLKSDGTVVALGDNSFAQCNVGAWRDIIQIAAGGFHTAGLMSNGTVVAVGDNGSGQCSVGAWTEILQIAAGGSPAYLEGHWGHTVGLRSDGTVVAVGANACGQCDVGGWTDIIQVAAGRDHTVGLKSDGTVVAVGDNRGQCDVAAWTDIVQVTAGTEHTIGLRSDGTVVAAGWNANGECDVAGWTDIVQVAANAIIPCTVGLTARGTVVAAGHFSAGQCDVGNWTEIIQAASGSRHTVGLKSDGTAVAIGLNSNRQCDVHDWTDIVQVTAGIPWTVGLRSDGTVVRTSEFFDECGCDVGSLVDVVQVSSGAHFVGILRSNGTVVAAGANYAGQCNVASWANIVQISAGYRHILGLKAGGEVVVAGDNFYGQNNVDAWSDIVQVAAGELHSVGLTRDGVVVAVGINAYGECDVDAWSGIAQIAAGSKHTVGLRHDGTVVAVGDNDYGQCNVAEWMDIVDVAAGACHTVGVKSDGTAVAAGPEIELAKILLLITASLGSPAEIRVRDSQGRVTGVIKGELRDEIPWATINREDERVTALYGFGDHCLEVEGVDDGYYGLAARMTLEGQTIMVTARSVSTAAGSVHRYHIDWYALHRGELGIMIEKDHDGDGEVDQTIVTDIPRTPIEPLPMNRATEVSLNQVLSWVGDRSSSVMYNVYFGTDTDDLELVSEGQPETAYVPALSLDTTYYWRIEAVNDHSISSSGDVWRFTTEGATSLSPCFIATAVYGTPVAAEIKILRDFRDQYLLTNALGQAFVDFYYRVSPPIARFITDHPTVKPIVRAALVPAIAMSTVAVDTTPTQKMLIVGSLLLISAVVATWPTRRRNTRGGHS